MTNFTELVLTCESWQEAQNIADELLEKKLVACIEFFDIKSKYRWHGKIEETKEVKLIMQTKTEYFDKIEATVKKLHSYDTPNLHAIPITWATKEIEAWLEKETDGN